MWPFHRHKFFMEIKRQNMEKITRGSILEGGRQIGRPVPVTLITLQMNELLRQMLQNTGGDKCLVNSPDAHYACSIRKGHEGDCKNPFAGVSWCGWCSAWTCRKPEIHGERTS